MKKLYLVIAGATALGCSILTALIIRERNRRIVDRLIAEHKREMLKKKVKYLKLQ